MFLRISICRTFVYSSDAKLLLWCVILCFSFLRNVKMTNHEIFLGQFQVWVLICRVAWTLIPCEQSLLHILARRRKERRLPKSCIFYEVAVAQVLERDKPVLFLSGRFYCARLCLNARAVTNTWAHFIKHMQIHLIVKTRSTDSSTLE